MMAVVKQVTQITELRPVGVLEKSSVQVLCLLSHVRDWGVKWNQRAKRRFTILVPIQYENRERAEGVERNACYCPRGSGMDYQWRVRKLWDFIIKIFFCVLKMNERFASLEQHEDYIQNSVSTSEIKAVIRTKQNDEDKFFKKWNLPE